jgi:hypothetical protein
MNLELETALQTKIRESIEVWEPCCHGAWLDSGIFLICRRGNTDVITLNPPSVGAHPSQVYERLLCDDTSISSPYAGGSFSLTEFDFTLPPSQLELVPEFFLRVFASPQIGPQHWFNRYRTARILIRSNPSGWGTIDDVLRVPGIPLNAS